MLYTHDQPRANDSDRPAGKRRLHDLLIRRDRLALAAAVFEAHDLGGPAEVRDIQFNIEAQLHRHIRAAAPIMGPTRRDPGAQLGNTHHRLPDLPREHPFAERRAHALTRGVHWRQRKRHPNRQENSPVREHLRKWLARVDDRTERHPA